jgi:hypothetical protein
MVLMQLSQKVVLGVVLVCGWSVQCTNSGVPLPVHV